MELPEALPRGLTATRGLTLRRAAQCGPISAVLSKKYIGEDAMAFPVDTGNFGGNSACSDTLAVGKGDGNCDQNSPPRRPAIRKPTSPVQLCGLFCRLS